MKRATVVVCVLLVAVPLAAAEKWWDAYKRGVASVQSGNYQAGIDALQRALAETPNEAATVRPRNEAFPYVPHYWIGVAKFQVGDTDGAVREWHTSEDQGAIQKTPLYAELRAWVGKAQAQKQRATDSATANLKRDANAAVGRAVSAQMDALAVGGDRSETYRAAQRKLQEAMDAATSADARSLRHALEVAQQSKDLFTTAAEEAKKAKIARRSTSGQPVGAVQPPPSQPAVPTATAATEALPHAQPKIAADVMQPAVPAPPPVVAAAQSAADHSRDQLQAAYRAFAAGDFATAEGLLNRIVSASASGEAYLLRGCVRYTRATLARQPDLHAAAADFRAALKANRALHLDRRAFSPKLVAFFESVK